MGKKERKMCFGIYGRVIIVRERGCLRGNFGIGRICVGWRGSGERFLGMRRGLGLGGSGFRFFFYLLFLMYEEDMVGFHLFFANVVIDLFLPLKLFDI